MKAQDIQARIDKVNEAIEKKHDLIGKRHAQIQKKLATLNKDAKEVLGAEPIEYDEDVSILRDRLKLAENWYFENRASDGDLRKSWHAYYWSLCDLRELIGSIESADRAIKEKIATRERYFEQLKKLDEKNEAINNMPQVIKDFMERTIEMWDDYDMNIKRPALIKAKEEYRALDKEWCALRNDWKNMEANKPRIEELNKQMNAIRSKFTSEDWNNYNGLLTKTDEQIHAENVENGKNLVLNFYERVCLIVGEVEDASGLRLDRNNLGYTIINGYAKGNGKIAKVESIGAGGYNIQRWHIRVLVHELKVKKEVA